MCSINPSSEGFFPMIFHFILSPLFKILFLYFKLLIYFIQLCFAIFRHCSYFEFFIIFIILKALSYKLSKSLALGTLL